MWEEVLLPYLWTGVERWMLKSDRLVCEKDATIAQSVTNYNLDPSILIIYEFTNHSWENLQQNTSTFKVLLGRPLPKL